MDYTGTARLIDVGLAASEDQVKELQRLGKSYNLILMSIDEDGDCKEIAENLLAQFNCKLVGLTDMEPQRIPNNTRKLFLHIHCTPSPILTTDEIGSIFEKIKHSMY
ncbi:uncharacterized protein LOC112202532 [Rosa chinensis]|uniref:uncharacterized protein LOC112202532 n=1 Tax=Rosa chinensis TaxID=74649 RepID=UPI000D08A5C5|nr:uncharacterized protein LOC112202532 [Rosa chinensis]